MFTDKSNKVDKGIISKIRKIFKLANDNYGNDAESLNIMAKAQRLMVEHNISMSDIEINYLHSIPDTIHYGK